MTRASSATTSIRLSERAAFKTPRHIPPDHFFFAASSAKPLAGVASPFQEHRSYAERDALNGVS